MHTVATLQTRYFPLRNKDIFGPALAKVQQLYGAHIYQASCCALQAMLLWCQLRRTSSAGLGFLFPVVAYLEAAA